MEKDTFPKAHGEGNIGKGIWARAHRKRHMDNSTWALEKEHICARPYEREHMGKGHSVKGIWATW